VAGVAADVLGLLRSLWRRLVDEPPAPRSRPHATSRSGGAGPTGTRRARPIRWQPLDHQAGAAPPPASRSTPPRPEPAWPTVVVRPPGLSPQGRGSLGSSLGSAGRLGAREASSRGPAGRPGPPPPPIDPRSLEGLHDAFSGEPLDPAQGLVQCRRCTVYYHAASYELLLAENRGHCVACGGKQFAKAAEAPGSRTPTGRGRAAKVVTIDDYRQHAGRVVTFEGTVHSLLRSRRGTDVALMFEPATWSKGFKLVVFQHAIARVGGEAFLQGLVGRRVRVRGLIRHVGQFGYQISLTDPAMILEVS
jgi:hypothetical protein